jgi:hypothetical protein
MENQLDDISFNFMTSVHLKALATHSRKKTEVTQWWKSTNILCMLERAVKVGEVPGMHRQVVLHAG